MGDTTTLTLLDSEGGTAPPAAVNIAASRANRQLLIAMCLCFIFMIGEVVGGYIAGSLAIMTECVCAPPPPSPLFYIHP
jgi:hypothetical protein